MAKDKVTYVRPELLAMDKKYTLIEDCIEGEFKIKDETTKYLPKPNSTDKSASNAARYEAYVLRAVFYNAVNRTLKGLNGQVFMRQPVLKLPVQLKGMEENVDGTISLRQLAKKANTSVLSVGRYGLLSDFPETEGQITLADLNSGKYLPTITSYGAKQITNWRETSYGSRRLVTLVVLKEAYVTDPNNIFQHSYKNQYRVLKLTQSGDTFIYSVEIQRVKQDTDQSIEFQSAGIQRYDNVDREYVVFKEYTPTDPNNKPFDFIPFSFVGSEDNDTTIDEPPLLDIAVLNIAHYRNSADYEESCYMVGQPTPVLTGLTEYWVKDVLGDEVFLGSRTSLPLPVGGGAFLLQAEPNSMPIEAMKQKEKQMVALGAKLIEPSSVPRTATEATIEKSAENSILSSGAKNVSSAIEQNLKWCARFIGASEDEIEYSLPTDFDLAMMTPEEKRQLNNDWLTGALAFVEMRRALKKSGQAYLDDDVVWAELEKKKADDLALVKAASKEEGVIPQGDGKQNNDDQ